MAALTQTPQSQDDLAARFTGKGKWKARLPELLATLGGWKTGGGWGKVRNKDEEENEMTHVTAELASLAAKLPPSDRLELVETILATLDKPDPEISAAWAAEAQDRLAAYRRGELAAVDESEVFGDLNRL